MEHDVTLDLYQQLLSQGDDWELRRQLKRWIPFETSSWRKVDGVITMSEKDRALVSQNGLPSSKVHCLANGVDLERFRPGSRWADPRRVLFIGSFAHLPNVLAVDFLLREVWPRLQSVDTTLHIIAGARHQYYLDRYQDRVHLNLAQPGLELEGFVADVRPAYERATVVVVPLLSVGRHQHKDHGGHGHGEGDRQHSGRDQRLGFGCRQRRNSDRFRRADGAGRSLPV